MDKHWSTVCALIVCALVHLCTLSSARRYAHTITEKPVECPRRRLAFGECIESCSHDSNCTNNQKCCFNGCGHECMVPVIAKPGFCPREHLVNGLCVQSCFEDNDCPDKKKCCSNGCGHECKDPAAD